MTADPTAPPPNLSLDAIELLVTRAEKRALFVEPRILRRVIMQDRRIPGLGLHVPHSRVYTIERERLLIVADRSELGLTPAAELPRRMILLGKPTDDEEFSRLTCEEQLHLFWRLVFHGRVHAEVEQLIEDQQLTSSQISASIRQIGAVEFAEVRHVLMKDEWLLPPHDDEEVYVEFLSVALELAYFSPWDLELFFPAIRDWEDVRSLWAELPHEQWYRETQPEGTPERLFSTEPVASPSERPDHLAPLNPSERSLSDSMRERVVSPLLIRATQSQEIGNHVKAAILSLRVQSLSPDRADQQRHSAEGFLFELSTRLQTVWSLNDEERDEWWEALCPLLTRAAAGYRSLEARILYDLQKVCVAHERGVYRFDVARWLLSFGKEPLRRQLPLLETVQTAKYLRSISDRASSLQIAAADRRRLMMLIDRERQRSDTQLRQTVRPLIEKTFQEVGLVPQNVPERAARRKVIEGLLDRLVERGFITMGDLRDALSQSHLKLPDVSGPLELAWGDRLLRADRKLGQVLDGVYRPGAIYLRMSQRLSSLAFGTAVGRFLVRHAVLPFGGAYLVLAAIMHFMAPPHTPLPVSQAAAVAPSSSTVPKTKEPEGNGHSPPESQRVETSRSTEIANSSTQEVVTPLRSDKDSMEVVPSTEKTDRSIDRKTPPGKDTANSAVEKIGDLAVDAFQGAKEVAESAATTAIKSALGDKPSETVNQASDAKPLPAEFYVAWGAFGVFLWMVIHRTKFRRSVGKFFIRLWNGSVWLIYGLPLSVLESTLVRRVLNSRAFQIFKSYLLRPAVVTLILAGGVRAVLVSAVTHYTWFESFFRLSLRGWLECFLLLNLFLNSPAGRSVEERVLDICVRVWHELRFRIFAVVYHIVMDLFHDVMQWIEQSLYMVDEWLRFRKGERRRFVLIKILFGSIWSVFSYVIRFVMTLLVEPQINPIKHFPVVTVSHKIMLPYALQLRDLIMSSTGVSNESAVAIAGTIVMLAPGVVGFLVWELKENWQLYVANRPRVFSPVRVGSHGESIVGLLRPGFRSGTLAKIFAKLRAALRKESDPGHGYRSTEKLALVSQVSREVHRFVERDLCAVLDEGGVFPGATVSVGTVHAATNCFDIELLHSRFPDATIVIRWEDVEGWLIARIIEPGWLSSVSPQQRDRVNVALIGLFQQAGVDLDREQLLTAISPQRRPFPDLEIRRQAIQAVSSNGDWALYPLDSERTILTPSTSESADAARWPAPSRSALIFRDVDLSWADWVRLWPEDSQSLNMPTELPRLIPASIPAQTQ